MAADEAESEESPPEDAPDDEWNFLHEELIPALVVGGVLLVLFPDPVTTTLGLALLGVGVVLWVWDLVR